jgi:hypothetical protein
MLAHGPALGNCREQDLFGFSLQIVALARPAGALILIDKDITTFLKLLGGPEMFRILVFSAKTDAIRCAVHEKRVRAGGGVPGDMDRRE